MYKYYTDNKHVYAVSTYAGKTVKGTATCHENDIFNLEIGKDIATARCNEKVAKKRLNRADRKLREAELALTKARGIYNDMYDYYRRSYEAYYDAKRETKNLLSEIETKPSE